MSPKDKPYGQQARLLQHRISILPRISSFETKEPIAYISETGHLPIVNFCKLATSTIIFDMWKNGTIPKKKSNISLQEYLN